MFCEGVLSEEKREVGREVIWKEGRGSVITITFLFFPLIRK